MLLYGKTPLPEPRAQRLNHPLALKRVLVENLPLVRRGSARFIQNLDVDGDLSHVMQQRRPSQSIAVGLREPEFVGDEVGVGANTF